MADKQNLEEEIQETPAEETNAEEMPTAEESVEEASSEEVTTGKEKKKLKKANAEIEKLEKAVAERDEKLEKLRNFYDTGLSHLGWDRYRIVDLRYKKQVICTE